MPKKIKFTIGLLGNVKMEGIGFTGRECDEKMAPIERALGGVSRREDKPEINMISEEQTHEGEQEITA